MKLFHASKDVFRRTQLVAQANQIEKALVELKQVLVKHEATINSCQNHLEDLKDRRTQLQQMNETAMTQEHRLTLRRIEEEIQQLEDYLITERPDQQLQQYRRRFQDLFKRLQTLYQKLPGKKQINEEDL